MNLSRDVNTASEIMYAMMAKGPVLTHFVANKQIVAFSPSNQSDKTLIFAVHTSRHYNSYIETNDHGRRNNVSVEPADSRAKQIILY
jgi:hypothetical protein